MAPAVRPRYERRPKGSTSVSAPLVVGTAGHVDHGKTSLVQALTGVDLDRLPEEKQRGITIALGFTPLPLPSGRVAGLVDVPWHEKLVRTMAAGASGMDAVMLCVAADDGAMPQTREHLAILGLMGVRAGLLVLTKGDLVDAETLDPLEQPGRPARVIVTARYGAVRLLDNAEVVW